MFNKDEEYWKKYRQDITKRLLKVEKVEKTPENIHDLALRIGVKATARQFNISPRTVRYWRDKLENESDKEV